MARLAELALGSSMTCEGAIQRSSVALDSITMLFSKGKSHRGFESLVPEDNQPKRS